METVCKVGNDIDMVGPVEGGLLADLLCEAMDEDLNLLDRSVWATTVVCSRTNVVRESDARWLGSCCRFLISSCTWMIFVVRILFQKEFNGLQIRNDAVTLYAINVCFELASRTYGTIWILNPSLTWERSQDL